MRAAAGLLIAAAVVAWCAVALLAGLSTFGRAVTEAGVRSAVANADPADRSILVRGAPGADPGTVPRWDAAVRQAHAGMAVDAAGYSSGWAFQHPPATRISGSPAYASITFLENLPAHARLTAGHWPAPGATPVQTALGEAVATTLGVRPGDRIPVVDRLDGSVTSLAVTGIWQPLDPADAYWRLAPDVFAGVAAQSATYGPLVVDRSDFARRFPGSASVAWLVEPKLTDLSSGGLRRLAAETVAAGTGLPPPSGLSQSASLATGLPGLAERVARAELVGRSALVTPILLVTVLGVYVLLLVASLLAENRRGEVALLRARGAARGRLAVLAAQESAVVVLPAVLAAPASVGLLGLADHIPPLSRHVSLDWRLNGTAWLVALAAAAGCALAITTPALRRGRTYSAELAERSRPPTRTPIQRMGLDLVLVALAGFGWLQLRQYASPLGGALDIDPVLAAGPTLGVLTAAVLSLRLARPAAYLLGRLFRRSVGLAATFGTWQAGRRPHAGPVVLVGLAVAAGTVSWCMAGTAERSVADQVDLKAGADLRLTEVSGSAPAGRAGQLAALPGVSKVLAAWRYQIALSADGGSGDLVAVDMAAADFGLIRKDVAGGDPKGLATRLAAGRDRAAQVVPVVLTPAALQRLNVRVGQSTTLTLAGLPVQAMVVGTMAAVPGTDGGPAVLADLPTLSAHVQARDNAAPAPQEWWLETTAEGHRAVASAAAALGGLRVTDRLALRAEAARDPFGVGARAALFGAAGGCLLLAAVGLAVDTWATTRRRAAELAVLQTLGAGPGVLARSLLVEQTLLAGVGAVAGLLSGVLVATAMTPLVLLTPAATRPVPVPIPQIDWWRSSGTAVLLLAIALGLSVVAAASARRGTTAARMRWGSDR